MSKEYTQSSEAVLKQLGVTEEGLSTAQAQERQPYRPYGEE